MKLRPQKPEETAAPASDQDDLGAMLAQNDAIGFPAAPAMDPRRRAKFYYWAQWQICDIAELMKIPAGTLSAWKLRDKWDEASPIERMEGVLEAKFVALVMKDHYAGGDFKAIDLLGRQAERLARVRRFREPGGNEGDLNPNVANRNAGPKKAPKRNQITAEQLAVLKADFENSLFDYQQGWNVASNDYRTRVILKSRQIGATWYFAREALIDALETGRNQIFLSASKSQAHVFRGYIVEWVKMKIGVDLTGDPIVIDRGEGLEQPTLYFLGTNARTAQGYHGNFYFDEFFWVYGFGNLNKVASGMAMHKRWRKTYFSTPSSINHEAYPFWTGDDWNRKRQKQDRKAFDTSWKATKGGVLLPDRIWRQTVTIEDAERGGCDLFDIEELRDEYSRDAFANLLMCEFVDDSLSVFPHRMLQPCLVDEWDAWPDVSFARQMLAQGRPFGNGEVWLSYDPNGDGENADTAGLVVVAPPSTAYPFFRVLERHQLRGSDFSAQAEFIRKVCSRYNVTKIDIDKTGIGNAVFQLVKTFFPGVRGHMYDPATKTRMVLKTLDVIGKGRLQWPAGWHDLTGALMTIRKTMTGSGRHMTYVASRTKNNGHADLAWALFQCLDNEPLEHGLANVRRSRLVIEHD